MAVYPKSVLGDVVSVLVAVRTKDGRVLWIGGKSRDIEFSFCRDPRDDMAAILRDSADWLGSHFDPYVEVRARITDYTGEWREGVPDVPKELGAGVPAIEAPNVPLLSLPPD